jgi:hypothetical protein
MIIVTMQVLPLRFPPQAQGADDPRAGSITGAISRNVNVCCRIDAAVQAQDLLAAISAC